MVSEVTGSLFAVRNCVYGQVKFSKNPAAVSSVRYVPKLPRSLLLLNGHGSMRAGGVIMSINNLLPPRPHCRPSVRVKYFPGWAFSRRVICHIGIHGAEVAAVAHGRRAVFPGDRRVIVRPRLRRRRNVFVSHIARHVSWKRGDHNL